MPTPGGRITPTRDTARMPPELKLKEGGKFPLWAISRGVIRDAVIHRAKGYFPVPALKHVRGPFLK